MSNCWFNRATRPAYFVWSAAVLRRQPKQRTGGPWGSYTWESPGLWAIKICLEMRRPLTLCAFTGSCNPELFLNSHLLPPAIACFCEVCQVSDGCRCVALPPRPLFCSICLYLCFGTSIVLVPKKTYRPMEQNRDLRNNITHLQPSDL